MSFYEMTDTERQILINQYTILQKGESNQDKLADLNKKIDYLERGYINLFKDLNSLQPIVPKTESIEVMNILELHDIITMSAKENNIKDEELAFDFNNDGSYPFLAKKAIESGDYPAFNNFKVINSHGSKNIRDHKRQLNYWKNFLTSGSLLSREELLLILDYRKLP